MWYKYIIPNIFGLDLERDPISVLEGNLDSEETNPLRIFAGLILVEPLELLSSIGCIGCIGAITVMMVALAGWAGSAVKLALGPLVEL